MVSLRVLAVMAVVCLLGCEPTGTGGGTASNAAGAGGAGGGAGAGGADAIPWDGSPYLGFGYDDAPCSAQKSFAEHQDGAQFELASTAIHVPVNGFITRVTVVHAIESAVTACTTSGRRVLVSEPGDDAVPVSPGVHETQTWDSIDVSDAALYPLPEAQHSKTVQLGRDLAQPMYVEAGQYVHIASVLDTPSVCVVACGALLDGSAPPKGDAHCSQADWIGCGLVDMAYVAWVDFAPE